MRLAYTVAMLPQVLALMHKGQLDNIQHGKHSSCQDGTAALGLQYKCIHQRKCHVHSGKAT